MSKQNSVRDSVTCLGGFLGMFLGAMLGFIICMKFIVNKIVHNDGAVQSNQALLAFLGVLTCGCIGTVCGALLMRLVFAAWVFFTSSK